MNNLSPEKPAISEDKTEFPNVDKRQVQRQFERAATGYDDASTLQRTIIERLHAIFEETQKTRLAAEGLSWKSRKNQTNNLVDLGCGTGYGLCKILATYGENHTVTGIDLSRTMLTLSSQACPSARLAQGDMESLPLSDDFADMAFSSSSLQWCDIGPSIAEIARILKTDGFFVASTFGPQTHREWTQAWERADETDGMTHTLSYPNLAEITQTLRHQNIEILCSHTETRKMAFKSAKDALMSVKSLGATNANAGRGKGLMGKRKFSRFVDAFREVSPDLSLTYEIFYVIGRKTS